MTKQYCIVCGNRLKKLVGQPLEGCLGYECETCDTILTHAEFHAQEPYHIKHVKDLLGRTEDLETRTTELETKIPEPS